MMPAFQPALSRYWLSVSKNLRLPSGVTLENGPAGTFKPLHYTARLWGL